MLRSLLLLFAFFSPLLALTSPYPVCVGHENLWPTIDLPPQLLDSATNGRRYHIRSSQNNTKLDILVLRGSAYEMGLAYGTLMKDDVTDSLNGMFNYIVADYDHLAALISPNLNFWLKYIPNLLKLTHAEQVGAILDVQYDLTVKFTPQRYEDEMRGLAEGAGLDLHPFPEACPAS